VRRPGPRPALLGRPGHISGVPSRPFETSGPATRPRRGLAPRRPLAGDWDLYQLIARHTVTFAPSNRPGLLALARLGAMRVRLYLLALSSCAVRERQLAPSRCEAREVAAIPPADSDRPGRPPIWTRRESAWCAHWAQFKIPVARATK
jgi:hypothetical protein